MKITTRLKVVGIVGTALVVILIAGHRRHSEEMSEELVEMGRSREQHGLAISIDRAFDREIDLLIAGDSPDALAASIRDSRRLLAQFHTSSLEENESGELALSTQLQALQAELEAQQLTPVSVERLAVTHSRVLRLLDEIVELEHGQLTHASESAAAGAGTSITVAIVGNALLGLFMIVGVVVPLSRYVKGLVATTRRIASGDLVTPVSLAGPPDLAELGRAVDSMRSALHENLGIEARIREVEEFDRKLRASEDRYRTLFDASPMPTWVIDADSQRLRRANHALVELSGYLAEELVGMPISKLIERGDGPSTRLRKENGELLELDVTSHTIRTAQGDCTLSVGKDMTEARRVEEQLRQAQKMEAIGQLAGGVAHDFNNILAVIQMNAELLGMDLGADHASADDVREIGIAAERGARLTRQLLAFSRKQQIVVKPVALNGVISELEKMLTRVVGEDVTIGVSQSSRTGVVNADPGQLEQVVMNLVVNARDAMPDGGRLTIETGATDLTSQQASALGLRLGRYAVLTVSDEGCGMDARTKARIFEPFFTTKEVGKGTGLGLANVFGIVSQCGGAVAVETEPGIGSTFRVYLPQIAERLSQAHQAVTATATPTKAATILVVEDEEAVRSAIARAVSAHGHRCIEARSPEHAIEIMRTTREPIDLLITDLVMPGMNGHALVAQARSIRPELKVLMMSGYTEHPSIKPDVEKRDELFIAKPFSVETLTNALHTALSDATVSSVAA